MSTLKNPLREMVYVVDDDGDVRDSLRYLLESVRLSVTEFSSGNEFLRAARPAVPACLLVDLRMPDLGGLDLIDALRARGELIPAVVITGFGDVSSTVRAFKSGAVDLIEKPFSPQIVIDTVQRLLRLDAQRIDDARARAEVEARLKRLSPREREVLHLVVEGNTNKEVAAAMGISVKTVEIHRKRMMEKLEAGSIATLVANYAPLLPPSADAPTR